MYISNHLWEIIGHISPNLVSDPFYFSFLFGIPIACMLDFFLVFFFFLSCSWWKELAVRRQLTGAQGRSIRNIRLGWIYNWRILLIPLFTIGTVI